MCQCVFRWDVCSVLVVHLTIFTQRAKKRKKKKRDSSCLFTHYPIITLTATLLGTVKLSCENRSADHATCWAHTRPGWQQIDVTRKVRVVLRYVGRQYDRFWTVSPQWDAILRVLNLPYLFQICIVCAVCECGIKYGDDLCNPVSYKGPYMQVVFCLMCCKVMHYCKHIVPYNNH